MQNGPTLAVVRDLDDDAMTIAARIVDAFDVHPEAAQDIARRVIEVLGPVASAAAAAIARQKRAYELRRSGLTWQDIADMMGYERKGSACAAARTHARNNGLTWPMGAP